VADGEVPQAQLVGVLDDLDGVLVVAQVLGRASADAEHGRVVLHLHLVEGDVGDDLIAGALLVGVPTGFEVVDHQVKALPGLRGDDGVVTGFHEPVLGVQHLVGLAAVSGDDENLLAQGVPLQPAQGHVLEGTR
jgi:hypothetical protein